MKTKLFFRLSVFMCLGPGLLAQSGSCGDGGSTAIRVRCFSSICGGFVSLTLVSSCTDPSNCTFWEDTFVDCCNIPTSVQVPIGFCGVLDERHAIEEGADVAS